MQYSVLIAAFAAQALGQAVSDIPGLESLSLPPGLASLSIGDLPSAITIGDQTFSVPTDIPTDPAQLSTYCTTVTAGSMTSAVGPGCTDGATSGDDDSDDQPSSGSDSNDAPMETSTGGAPRETGLMMLGGAAAGIAALAIGL